mgnify:CR=1 FL=1
MRKVTEQIKLAFEQGTSKKVGNTETDGQTVWLHGNAIIKRDAFGVVEWSLAGWNTPTARDRARAGTRHDSDVGVDHRDAEPAAATDEPPARADDGAAALSHRR